MQKMEVFLSAEAIQSFTAFQCNLTDVNTDGFLIGHKRGDLFFVEKIFPSKKGFFPSTQKYFDLQQSLDDKILGFYSHQTSDNKLKKILAPIAYGKIFLRLDMDENDQWMITPYAIEYQEDFFLLPIDIKYAR
jgi:hypothetical protein